jgi:hypothetical protein
MDPCGQLNQQDVCNTANGLLTRPVVQLSTATSDVAPENNVTGLTVGQHFYFRTSTGKLYIFNGTVGTKVGWVILN